MIIGIAVWAGLTGLLMLWLAGSARRGKRVDEAARKEHTHGQD